MIYVSNLNLWMILLIISQVSAVSYNQPTFSSNTSWNPNGTTFADNNTIGQSPFDIFININNTVYVPNQQNGQIIIWSQENQTLTTNNSITSSNLSNPYSLFVTISGDIYIDTLNSIGSGVSKWTSNLTNDILTMRTCQKCWDIFVDISNVLYCSLDGRHQVIAKSLNYTTNRFMIVAGTGSPDTALNTLDNPRGIFVDINFDLYVADCGNDRIQLFHSGNLTGIIIAGNTSLNITITLNCPTGIILDGDNYLFIVDHNNHRVIRSGPNGFQCLFGCLSISGLASNQLNSPWSLSFDSYGNIFVTDQGNNRIQKFILSTNSNNTSTTISITTATTATTAALTVYGPQLNFNLSSLTGAWSLCYSALYSVPMYPNISSILSTCYKSKLLLGCRSVGNTLLTLAAMGDRADVLYNCSANNTMAHQANGVGWYFSMDIGNWNSWGFVYGSNSVQRQNCDTDTTTNSGYRLCWHMIGTSGGYRCGSSLNLDTSTSWERVIYHAM